MGTQLNKNEADGYDHKLRVYSNITQMIANPENPTPLVRVNRINQNPGFQVYLKLERYNPFGSVKDRIALEMLNGLDAGNRTVIEPSSGNTGIALAGLANASGLAIEIAVPERIPEEKKVLLSLMGVKVREADDALCPLFPTEGARGLVNALVSSPATRDNYISPNQYENELNVQAHYRTTGPEIWLQTAGKIGYFFAGLGTGGTISGVGKYLKEKNPAVKIIAVEPSSSNHNLPGLKRITGLSKELEPKILDRSVIDEVVEVTDEDAYQTAIDLARKDGILVGPTTGAILHVALQLGKTNRGVAVAISPDDAFKYASFYKNFLGKEPGEARIKKLDIRNFVCPLSKMKATELLDSMTAGETAEIVLGDKDSLRSVAQELRTRGLKSSFRQEDEAKFVLSVTK
ncbi:MAG: pyridoxal-phosphate dependent enzyme [Dehalococcoidia bacterium]|nr:MAG: pyridoxal-phosphate dependent enzyme [Dehalococcoidia bacterium]